jgi:hypothetical protein
VSEPGRPRLARSRMSDPGPRQEVEKTKLSGNRRGVGWVHSTGETLEQSREERWRRGRREGTQSEEEVDAEARPGRSAGFGVSQEAPIRGSNLNGPPKPRTSITLTSDKSPVRESVRRGKRQVESLSQTGEAGRDASGSTVSPDGESLMGTRA